MLNVYTGIGSRNTPIEYLNKIKWITEDLLKLDYIPRTSYTEGADRMFYNASQGKSIIHFLNEKKEQRTYLPFTPFFVHARVTEKALEIAERHHPKYNELNDHAKTLMGLNVHLILGQELTGISDFVLAYTQQTEYGGVMFCKRLADSICIPFFNLYNQEDMWNEYFDLLKNDEKGRIEWEMNYTKQLIQKKREQNEISNELH